MRWWLLCALLLLAGRAAAQEMREYSGYDDAVDDDGQDDDGEEGEDGDDDDDDEGDKPTPFNEDEDDDGDQQRRLLGPGFIPPPVNPYSGGSDSGLVATLIKLHKKVQHLHKKIKEPTPSEMPCGAIISWVPRPSKKSEPIDIPDGWVPCDGQKITEGKMKGTKTPNLNPRRMFIRGSKPELAGKPQMMALQEHGHRDTGHTHATRSHNHGTRGHRHSKRTHTHRTSPHRHRILRRSTSRPHAHKYRDLGFRVDRRRSTQNHVCVHNKVEAVRQCKSSLGYAPIVFTTRKSNYGGHTSVRYDGWTANSRVNIKANKAGRVASGRARVRPSGVRVLKSKSNIGKVTHAKKGGETRPKNMSVVFLMKVC